jgi:uncharacterized membrane protein
MEWFIAWNDFCMADGENILHLFSRYAGIIFCVPGMWLNSFGIYIGRYLRFNSWDIITNPLQLSYDIGRMLMHSLFYREGWSMIFCFSILKTLMYLSLKKMNKGKLEMID